jgi:hypothetical protein
MTAAFGKGLIDSAEETQAAGRSRCFDVFPQQFHGRTGPINIVSRPLFAICRCCDAATGVSRVFCEERGRDGEAENIFSEISGGYTLKRFNRKGAAHSFRQQMDRLTGSGDVGVDGNDRLQPAEDGGENGLTGE